MRRQGIWVFALLSLLMVGGCSRQKASTPGSDQSQATTQPPASATPAETPQAPAQPAPTTSASVPRPTEVAPSTGTETQTRKMAEARPLPPKPAPTPIVVPSGTVLTVKLRQPIGSKTSHTGDKIEATLAQPVVVHGKVVVPAGASAYGTITQAQPAGRFKGGAVLSASLNVLMVNGNVYKISTRDFSKESKGKGKRTAAMIGGGGGAGALIGGLAGGGKGAAIGALVGAGGGTAVAATTGDRDITLPVESVLAFSMTSSLTLPPSSSIPRETKAANH